MGKKKKNTDTITRQSMHYRHGMREYLIQIDGTCYDDVLRERRRQRIVIGSERDSLSRVDLESPPSPLIGI